MGLKFGQKVVLAAKIYHQRAFICAIHNFSPKLVYHVKFGSFQRQLLDDFGCFKNALEVLPVSLARQPFIDSVGNEQ